jgi:PKD repeat protein
MTVATNFTADITSGAVGTIVNFTDTSTGSPDNWLWDFGDGHTSEDQNPTHQYLKSGSFTVTLTAFISTGTTVVGVTSRVSEIKSASASNNQDAYDAFIAASFSGSGTEFGQYSLQQTAPGPNAFGYAAQNSIHTVDLTAHSSGIAKFEMFFNDAVDNPDSTILFGSGKRLSAPATNIWTFIEDVSGDLGEIMSNSVTDLNFPQFASPGNGFRTGWIVTTFRVTIHTAADNDTKIKTDFISISGPVADFSATPRKKKNSLTSVFTNLSSDAITYSWKRRPSGIKADYVEFSTDENPSEGFDITNPTP